MNSFRQRDTPTRSPFTKTPQPRSPSKVTRQELGLYLDQVIGTTCNAASRFDVDRTTNSFAYVAGAAAVIATIDRDNKVTQKFFRANASQTTVAKPPTRNGSSTPSAVSQDIRSRLGHRGREGSPFASSSTQEGLESPGTSSSHAKDKVKAATAVALSKNGKWLAYGETGYRPRVLVFPVTENKSSDQPSAIISEHSFGVQAIAFDSEGKLLATLGVINDGFLHVWDIDQKTGATTLLASNKCTTLIKQVAWIGRNLVTVGVRYIRVWRPDEISPSSGIENDQWVALSNPGHKPLAGRNSLLGDLLEVTFTAVVPLSDSKAIICSDAGDICLLDDAEKQQRLTRLLVEDFSITAACLSEEGSLIVTGSNDTVKTVPLQSLHRPDTPTARCPTPSSRRLDQKTHSFPVAAGALAHVLVTVDNHRNILFSAPSSETSAPHSFRKVSSMASHSDAILGIRSVISSFPVPTAFATWSSGGSIIGWLEHGRPSFQLQIPLDQFDDVNEMVNELKTIAFFPRSPLVVSGDRYGILRIVEIESQRGVLDVRAHSNEITDISVCEVGGTVLLATASRDRTVQVFAWEDNELELLQTLDEHAGAVVKVKFTDDGRNLLSSSADRSIVVRERIEGEHETSTILYGIVRTINLKSAPTAMEFASHADYVLVSAADRTINTVNFQNGRIVSTIKAGDNDGGDPVILSGLAQIASATGAPMIGGVSSVDKSIRIYSEEGSLLARDWGHTEGVTDIALLRSGEAGEDIEGATRLVTAAADGTIFIWATTQSRKIAGLVGSKPDDVFAAASSSSPLARPPLRKVISQSEIVRLRRSMASPMEHSEPTTPTGLRSPPVGGLKKKRSRLSIAQVPKLNASTPRTPSTEAPGSPISRVRNPSPSRSSQYTGRSPSRSLERVPKRQTSQVELRRHEGSVPGASLEAPVVRIPHPSENKVAVSKEPSKDPEGEKDSAATSKFRTTDLLERMRAFRIELGQRGEAEGETGDEQELVEEMERLLQAVKRIGLARWGQERTNACAESDKVTRAESDAGGAQLQVVEERCER
ncbi:WD40 repeat-like protein [Myriangium duriaei CBS 260.36]|uniref:WD40 repeat-like protein n=1 Tax=Myriangium duriaei CBS 260.36 TaxID=1168546 RepID=A0A9P4J3Z9_9PEZI|nr:WD40 repeat-like protein [Myriangium duriaei CBS 260.36]